MSIESNPIQNSVAIKKNPNPKIAIVFIVIIILRSILLQFVSIASGGDVYKYNTYLYIDAITAYTIIVLSIVIFHGHGLDVFQDHISLWTIVFTCFIRSSLGVKNEIIYRGVFFFLGLVLSVFILSNRKSLKLPSLRTVFTGLIWSAVSVVGVTVGVLFRVFSVSHSYYGTLPPNLSNFIYSDFIFNFSFVAVIEEGYFRGLLFNFLTMNGWKEDNALLFQALLFWGSHYVAEVADPIMFFVILPLLTLLQTWVIKKYKMLYLPIMIHVISDVFGDVLFAILYHS